MSGSRACRLGAFTRSNAASVSGRRGPSTETLGGLDRRIREETARQQSWLEGGLARIDAALDEGDEAAAMEALDVHATALRRYSDRIEQAVREAVLLHATGRAASRQRR